MCLQFLLQTVWAALVSAWAAYTGKNLLLCEMSQTGVCCVSSAVTFTVPLSQRKKKRCWMMMQGPAISLHCVMLLPGFLEFPLFLTLVAFYTRQNGNSSGNELQVSQHVGTPDPILGQADFRRAWSQFLRPILAEMVSRFSSGQAVSLGWPRSGSGHERGLSEVITPFMGQLCATPRISHTLTAPFSSTPSHSPHTVIIHSRQSRHQLHKLQTCVCRVSLTASGRGSLRRHKSSNWSLER